jgi:hypothetical protein
VYKRTSYLNSRTENFCNLACRKMQIQEKQKENWIFFLKACVFIKNERKWELKFPGMFSLFSGVSDLRPKVDSEFKECSVFWSFSPVFSENWPKLWGKSWTVAQRSTWVGRLCFKWNFNFGRLKLQLQEVFAKKYLLKPSLEILPYFTVLWSPPYCT